MQPFTARDVNNVVIRRSDGDGADRLTGLLVEDRRPGAAIVVRLPHAAIHRADIEKIRLVRYAGDRPRPASPKRPNHAPAHFLIHALRILLGLADAKRRNGETASEQNRNEAMKSNH